MIPPYCSYTNFNLIDFVCFLQFPLIFSFYITHSFYLFLFLFTNITNKLFSFLLSSQQNRRKKRAWVSDICELFFSPRTNCCDVTATSSLPNYLPCTYLHIFAKLPRHIVSFSLTKCFVSDIRRILLWERILFYPLSFSHNVLWLLRKKCYHTGIIVEFFGIFFSFESVDC